MDPLALSLELAIPLVLIALGFTVGRLKERRHFRMLDFREGLFRDMLVTDLKSFPGGVRPGTQPTLVCSEVVIATDYWKSFAAGIRKFFGGEMKTYLSLIERARREVLLRLRDEAEALGCDAICNVRLDTANIGGADGKVVPMVCLYATGTAYRRAG